LLYRVSPLILTFSRREKKPPLIDFVKSVSLQAEFSFRFAKTQGALLPLPAGEGRGEGDAKIIYFLNCSNYFYVSENQR
jgi:hypothetical protein